MKETRPATQAEQMEEVMKRLLINILKVKVKVEGIVSWAGNPCEKDKGYRWWG